MITLAVLFLSPGPQVESQGPQPPHDENMQSYASKNLILLFIDEDKLKMQIKQCTEYKSLRCINHIL